MPQQIAAIGRILAVTGQPVGEDSVCALLDGSGHVLMTAATTEQALAMAAASAPDLILLDLPVPGLISREFLDTLHGQPLLQQIPVIVLSPNLDQDRLLRAFDAGAMDCIGKPCEADELLARVNVHLRLKLTRDRLAQVARERQELVTLVAHDLKNPLTSVLFACEMLALPDCRPERVPRYLQIIGDSARDALSYICDYLETQAASARPGAASARACTHIDDTLRWLAARYELQLESSGLQLRVGLPGGHACVGIHANVLRQIGENLVGNALKYARGGGELELLACPGATGFWQLVVQDRGPGVPPGFQPQLFQPFQRLQANDAYRGVSSGLGLSLSQQIVTSAGGRLWYEDREGGGACFKVELPEVSCNEHCD